MTIARADLHVHSKYSDRPSEWLLRRIGAPESFVEPLELYERARQRGMQFVTISDHNRIDGALEIAHLPGTFISSEVTTYFPEDGCKVHCLVSGITPGQFAAIDEVRENIYDLQQYCADEDVIVTVAHPLFRVNNRLLPEQLEKLILLFKRFEAINGSRDPRASQLATVILRNLTPELIERMADEHGIEPADPQPWIKHLTAGSDDHGGLYIASAYTTTPPAASVSEFLQHLRDGRHEPAGAAGTSLRLAHSFYTIAYSYYRRRLAGRTGGKGDLLGELFRQLLDGPRHQPAGITGRVRSMAGRLLGSGRRQLSAVERTIIDDLRTMIRAGESAGHADQPCVQGVPGDQRSFQLACRVSQQLSFAFLQRFVHFARDGRLIESLQTVASLGPVAMGIAPYLAAFSTQHKDEAFLQQVAARFDSTHHLRLKSGRRAWITDTFTDVNGVSRSIHAFGAEARRAGLPLTIITCLDEPPFVDLDVHNFRPVGSFSIPEYRSQALAFPPFLEMIQYLERERFGELIISTPGPMGLVALLAGRLLGLKLTGIYHTDFPTHVSMLTQDGGLEQATWKLMHCFYNQLDAVLVPSECYIAQLVTRGFDRTRLCILPRGVDLARYNPGRRDLGFWSRFGLDGGFKFIYVGRVSKEKNLEVLAKAFLDLRRRGRDVQLVIIGDGPHLPELRRQFCDPRLAFTGFLRGDDLADAYASADAMVFPSESDTFGNAVLEAMASGLPVIASERGGPAEIIGRHGGGLAVDTRHPGPLAEAMNRFATDPDLCRSLRQQAIAGTRGCTWHAAMQTLWTMLDDQPAAAPAKRDPALVLAT